MKKTTSETIQGDLKNCKFMYQNMNAYQTGKLLYHIIPWRLQKKVKSIIGKKFLLPSSLFFHDCQSFLIILIESGNSKFPLLTRKLASICTSSWVNTQNLMIWLSNENDIQLLWHTQFLKYCVNTVLSETKYTVQCISAS